MPAINDLTWANVETALGNDGAISFEQGVGIVIKPALLTGDPPVGVTEEGVIEFLHKFMQACNAAQSTVNNGQLIGQRLAAFPPSFATSPLDNYVQVTQQLVSRVPLNTSLISGINE